MLKTTYKILEDLTILHIRTFILISFCFVGVNVFAQGKVSRPHKSNSHSTQSQKTQTIQEDPQKRYNDSIANLPREEEYINNILVRWRADITNEQKSAITQIINNIVDIEGGVFLMGSDSHDHYCDYGGTRYYLDSPRHSERAKSFKLSKYETTQEIWEAIMGNNPSRYWGDNFPVTDVSWYDCQAFIEKIQQLSDVSFRLPTEVEWEYVATKNLPEDHYEKIDYIKGTEWVSYGVDKMLHSVGTKECNSFGIYDIIGNVREWTSDHASLDYKHPHNLYDYIMRGSTYNSWSATHIRYSLSPSSKNDVLGFRIAL